MRDLAPDAGTGEAFIGSPTTHLLRLKDRAALFCARRQQLFALNETALLIWEGLADGEPTSAVAERLEALGLRPDEARRYVDTAATGWAGDGHLALAAASARQVGRPAATRTLAVDGFRIDLRLHGDVATADIDAVFAHLAVEAAGPPDTALALVEHDGRHVLFADGAPRGETDARGAAPALKALITELYAASATDGFLTHGALLRGGGKTLFLTGEPGAGKTTLTLALAAAGLAYGGDDIVRISGRGLATAAPFAAAAKSGAWDLLADRIPGLATAAVHRRADGQAVRYLVPESLAPLAPAPLDILLLLAREPGAAPRLDPVHPLDALVVLLDSAFSRKGAADGETLSALAARLEGAACFRFVYSGLDDAVAAVAGLL